MQPNAPSQNIEKMKRCLDFTFTWRNIFYKVKDKKGCKTVLKDLHGSAVNGMLTAVMGLSGSGKTSLLNILAGITRDYKGELLINDRPRDAELLKSQVCYVRQEQALLPLLTVQEALTFAAEFLLSKDISRSEKQTIVNETANLWNLRKCLHTKTQKLSGGEVKRLAIAQELIRKPSVIIIDEPTSGLDSTSSLHCIEVLKGFSDAGHTVIITVHQPSSRLFHNFDKVIVLAHQQCIYNGESTQLIPFLEGLNMPCPKLQNPADFILEIATQTSEDNIRQMASHFSGAENSLQTHEDRNYCTFSGEQIAKKGLLLERNNWHQFSVHCKRMFISTLRSKIAINAKLATYILICILTSVFFHDCGRRASDIIRMSAVLVYFCVASLFTALVPAVILFTSEARIIAQEYRNQWYKLEMYFLAKIATELPFQVIPSAVVSSCLYILTSQETIFWKATTFTLILVLHTVVSHSLGMAVSAASTYMAAVVMGSLCAVTVLLFGGVLASISMLAENLRWLLYSSFFFFTYSGSLSVLYGYGRPPLECTSDDSGCILATPEDIARNIDFKLEFLSTSIVALISYALLFKTMAFFLLKLRCKYAS